MIQKLTKREATLDDVNEAKVPKVRKTATRSKPFEYNVYDKKELLTRLLDGKEICVVNGTDDLEKEQIEEVLRQHSATIVQNPRNTTFCVIVGNDRTVRNTYIAVLSRIQICICAIITENACKRLLFSFEGRKW